MPISGPKHSLNHPDRLTDCEAALEDEVHRLVDKAIKAGWTLDEACLAITSISDHRILSQLANEDVRQRIASADPNSIILRRPP
jgi:hypothetical protein